MGGGGGGVVGTPNPTNSAGRVKTNGSAGGAGRDGKVIAALMQISLEIYPGGGAQSITLSGAGGGGGATGSGTRGCVFSQHSEGATSSTGGAVYPGFESTSDFTTRITIPQFPSPVRTVITAAGFYGAGGGGGSGGSTADPTASFRRMGIGGQGQSS